MGRKILIIVDAQYGFIEGGSLGVDGAREAMNRLVEFIEKHYKEYDGIFLTADWHPITHCSFKDNGGIWPTHCVQFSQGAAIYQPILDVLDHLKIDYDVLTKGCDEDHEEYSIFKNVTSEAYLKAMNKHNEISEVHVCGLALDFCVKDSILDGKKTFVNSQFKLIKDCTAAIGNPEDTYKVLEDNNVIII